MIIENSQLTDLPVIFELYHAASDYMKSKNQVYWPKFPIEMVVREIEENHQWKLTLGNKIACILAIALDDELIWGNKENEASIYLHRIAVHPNFRGQNFVEKITHWANEFGKNMGSKYVRIDTVGLNKTLIRHYGKSGLEFLDIKPLKSTSGLPEQYKAGEVCYFQKEIV